MILELKPNAPKKFPKMLFLRAVFSSSFSLASRLGRMGLRVVDCVSRGGGVGDEIYVELLVVGMEGVVGRGLIGRPVGCPVEKFRGEEGL